MLVGKDGHPFCEVDEERLSIPGKQRTIEILCAVRLLQREGFGKTTPNQVSELITNAIQKQKGLPPVYPE